MGLPEWVEWYRDRGYNPMPSLSSEKRLPPWMLWSPYKEHVFQGHWPSQCGNIQLMLGCYWSLCVIDLDGLGAVDRFFATGDISPTWIVRSSSGYHVWLDPEGQELPRCRLWGDRHEGAEFLCESSLIVAPPSVHPETKHEYHFLPGWSPESVSKPAPIPRFIRDMMSPKETWTPRPRPAKPSLSPHLGYDRDRVLEAITDKARYAASWGLRLTGRTSGKGWMECRSINNEDRNPSAAFHRDTGVYRDFVTCECISFFDLSVRLGAYATWRDCCDDLGQQLRVRKS